MKKNKIILLTVLFFTTFFLSSCDEDSVINYADDLPDTYQSALSGDINVEGAVNVITISNSSGSNALKKRITVKITNKSTQTNLGVDNVRYSTNDTNVDITRVDNVITLRITGSEYVQNSLNLYVGARIVD